MGQEGCYHGFEIQYQGHMFLVSESIISAISAGHIGGIVSVLLGHINGIGMGHIISIEQYSKPWFLLCRGFITVCLSYTSGEGFFFCNFYILSLLRSPP